MLLQDGGEDVNARDKFGAPPLRIAAEWDDVRCARLLLRAGAHVNARENNGRTPLHTASHGQPRGGRPKLALMTLLLQAGADINASDKNGMTPLHCAANMGTDDAATLLLQQGANVNQRDKFGQTPLHFATRRFNILHSGRGQLFTTAMTFESELVLLLLRAGAEPAVPSASPSERTKAWCRCTTEPRTGAGERDTGRMPLAPSPRPCAGARAAAGGPR